MGFLKRTPTSGGADGYPVTDEAAGHLTPARHDHIPYGTYEFDVESEL